MASYPFVFAADAQVLPSDPDAPTVTKAFCRAVPVLLAAKALPRGVGRKPCRKQRFRQKVYGLLFLQIGATAALCGLATGVGALRTALLAEASHIFVASSWGLVLSILGMAWYRRCYPANVLLLAAITFLVASQLAVVCAGFGEAGGAGVVFQAAVTTVAAVLGLTLHASVQDGHGLGWAAMSGLSVAFCVLAIMEPNCGLWAGALGAVVFSGLFVVHTEMMLLRGDDQDCVTAALQLYLDVVNLFLRILRLLARLQRRR